MNNLFWPWQGSAVAVVGILFVFISLGLVGPRPLPVSDSLASGYLHVIWQSQYRDATSKKSFSPGEIVTLYSKRSSFWCICPSGASWIQDGFCTSNVPVDQYFYRISQLLSPNKWKESHRGARISDAGALKTVALVCKKKLSSKREEVFTVHI